MSAVTSPFKFLDSYQREDLDIFFGRERETEDLYDALSGVKHLLVYGPSGSGKTSLIECGLRNRFSDADWYALSIRRGGNMTASVFARINEALRRKIQIDPDTKLPTNSDIDFGHVVEQLFDERYKPVYLLFDQFEELLISGEDAEKRDFFARLDRLIRYKVPCRVLLVMREEFIGHFSEFELLCPSIFQHRFRLEKMGRVGVHEVIEKILTATHYLAFFTAPAPEALAGKILTKLPDQHREIELTHVQVFLSELWDRAQESQASALPELHAGLVREEDNLEGVLNGFLRNQLRELDATYGQNTALEVLAAMISERHTKLQVDEVALAAALEKNNITLARPMPELLRDLERRRILRTLKSGDQTQYEISHDVLARVVGQNLTEEMKLRERAREVYRVYEGRTGLFSREDLDYLRGFEVFLAVSEGLKGRMVESEDLIFARLEAEKVEIERRRRKAVWTALMAVMLILVAIAATIFAFIKSSEAEQEAQNASEAIVRADKATKLADDKTRQANWDRIQVEQKTGQADSLSVIATKLKSEAEKSARLVVFSRLADARKQVVALEYGAAYRTLQNAEELGVMSREVGLAMYEIAYWLMESGNFAKAEMAANRVAKLLGKVKTGTITNLKNGRAQLQKMNADEYLRMRERYFPVMSFIPAGTAILGSEEGANDEKPPHPAILSSFKMARTETTWWQYNLFCEATEREKPEKPAGWGGEGDNPVINVSWLNAVDYANWLNKQEGLDEIMTKSTDGDYELERSAKGYRLPTEAEWEYAAGGGSQKRTQYAGTNDDEQLKVYAWYGENSGGRTRTVGTRKANALGLYDMSGNVWEWCWDWHGDYLESPEKDYTGPENGSSRVVRGGGWGLNPVYCRVAYRTGYSPDTRYFVIGFRLVFVP
jgi:formylglycine-generating enzyme required for sulfatase activity/AAA+ ATPase superfamily predicted ATPase